MAEPIFIYLLRGDETFGPYPHEQFDRMLETNQVLDDDLACIAGDQEWRDPFAVSRAAEDQNLAAQDVEEFAQSFETDLMELQTMGYATKTVSTSTKREILAKASAIPDDAELTLQEFLFKHFRHVLTEFGREDVEEERRMREQFAEENKQEWHRQNRTAEFAPKISIADFVIPERRAGERDASDKQLSYLRDLGVLENELPRNMGLWQASALINFVKEKRGD